MLQNFGFTEVMILGVLALIARGAWAVLNPRKSAANSTLGGASTATANAYQPYTPALKFCFACGEQIDSRAEICPKCGVRQPDVQQPRPMGAVTGSGRNRTTAALFAIFLGGIGAHKFYLGRVGWGIVYLLFCWTFIPAVIGVIEGIVLLAGSDAEFVARHG